MFLISVQTEKQVAGEYGGWRFFWLALGLLLMLAGVFVQSRFDIDSSREAFTPYVIASFAYLTALLAGWTWTVHNSLVSLRQRVKQAWSQVEIQLKRRHDLISYLLPVVEGYKTHEKETQTLVVALRTQFSTASDRPDAPELRGVAPEIKVIVEQYPDLKAGESFLALQRALSDTENRIALARSYYNNDIATYYNSRLVILPGWFVAALTRLTPQPLMNAAGFERAPVEVKLAS